MTGRGVIDLDWPANSRQPCRPMRQLGAGHVRRKARVRAGDGPSADAHVPALCRPLQRRSQRQELHLPGPAAVHGVRPADLPRKPARHRHLPPSAVGQALSHGAAGPCRPLDIGRGQRRARLAPLCDVRADADCPGAQALCRRAVRRRAGGNCLRAGHHKHRAVPVAVPLGRVQAHQGGRAAAHAARPQRQHPDLHPHRRRQVFRQRHPGCDRAGGRCDLRDGPRLCRLRPAQSAELGQRPSSWSGPRPA